MRKALSGLFAATLLTVTMAGTGSAADFQNGSFDDGDYVANGGYLGSFMKLFAGADDITGWVVGGAGIDWKGSAWVHADGPHSIDLNHTAAGSISQTFDTAVNVNYRVDFKFSGNPAVNDWDCPASGYDPDDPQYSLVKTMTVRATGGRLEMFAFDTSRYSSPGPIPLPMTWVDEEYLFPSVGTSTTLTFASTSTSNCGPAIDNVRLHLAVAADCKDGGWKSMADAKGRPFKSAGACLKSYR